RDMTYTTAPRLRRRHTIELAMLAVALTVFATGLCLTGLQLHAQVPDLLWLATAVLGGSALAVHVALRFCAPWADPLILPLAVLLNGIGPGGAEPQGYVHGE